MALLKYGILALLLMNIPSTVMVYISPSISSLLSILSFLLLLIYYILTKKTGGLNVWMIVLGLLFFSISSLSGQQYLPEEDKDFIIILIKYFIVIICGYELLKNTSTREITLFLFIGALTVVLQIFLFNNPLIDGGRYSGFYLNPNNAGFACLIGYALSFAPQNKRFRLILQIVFTIMGLLTFSRTFILVWLLINLISIRIDFKNIRVFLYGFGFLTLFIIFSEFLPVKNPRLEQLKAFLNGEQVRTEEVSQGSRTETWSLYYDALFDRPVLGNGFGSFSGGKSHISHVGAHNTFLKVWGEAGILPFITMVLMYLILIRNSLQLFDISPHLFLMSLGVILYLMTNHNFFETGYILFISMWIQSELQKQGNAISLEIGENQTKADNIKY